MEGKKHVVIVKTKRVQIKNSFKVSRVECSKTPKTTDIEFSILIIISIIIIVLGNIAVLIDIVRTKEILDGKESKENSFHIWSSSLWTLHKRTSNLLHIHIKQTHKQTSSLLSNMGIVWNTFWSSLSTISDPLVQGEIINLVY